MFLVDVIVKILVVDGLEFSIINIVFSFKRRKFGSVLMLVLKLFFDDLRG